MAGEKNGGCLTGRIRSTPAQRREQSIYPPSRSAYLQQLAGETGLSYARLTLPANLANLLAQRPEWASNTGYPHPISWFPALLALTSLVILLSLARPLAL